ncbi:hypothetical protein L914_05683 [Phytophthora nicotianae]|uniref:Uncharacterized protein n=1 Tax=Phytophthora nicotianae TaxID=4792 RepID=W2NNV8_PHYNI|nr:hypothetical protein L914_05683 [Phytophthora nicotianae]
MSPATATEAELDVIQQSSVIPTSLVPRSVTRRMGTGNLDATTLPISRCVAAADSRTPG